MPDTRYYVLAKFGTREVELFKLVQRPTSAVIASPLLKRLVGVENIHVTHHPPKGGRGTRIVHLSDAAGTDARILLDPQADAVELIAMVIDLSEFDWADAKPFAKSAYAEKWVLDVEQDGPYVFARFFLGSPDALLAAMDHALTADASPLFMLIPKPTGFGTLPGGHPINYTRIGFDDEAEVTLGCLFLQCHPPEGNTGPEKPWRLGRLEYVAYGSDGEYITRGNTDS